MNHHLINTLFRRSLFLSRPFYTQSTRLFQSTPLMSATTSKRKADVADADEPVTKKATTSKAAPKKAAKEPKEPVSPNELNPSSLVRSHQSDGAGRTVELPDVLSSPRPHPPPSAAPSTIAEPAPLPGRRLYQQGTPGGV